MTPKKPSKKLGRPPGEPTARLNIRLPVDLLDSLAHVAEIEGRTQTEIIRRAAQAYVDAAVKAIQQGGAK